MSSLMSSLLELKVDYTSSKTWPRAFVSGDDQRNGYLHQYRNLRYIFLAGFRWSDANDATEFDVDVVLMVDTR